MRLATPKERATAEVLRNAVDPTGKTVVPVTHHLFVTCRRRRFLLDQLVLGHEAVGVGIFSWRFDGHFYCVVYPLD